MDLYSLMAYLEELKKRQGQRLQVPMSAGGFPMGGAEGMQPMFLHGNVPGVNGAPMRPSGEIRMPMPNMLGGQRG